MAPVQVQRAQAQRTAQSCAASDLPPGAGSCVLSAALPGAAAPGAARPDSARHAPACHDPVRRGLRPRLYSLMCCLALGMLFCTVFCPAFCPGLVPQVQAAEARAAVQAQAATAAQPVTQPDPDLARKMLETSIERILSLLKNPNYVNPATRGPYRRQIEDEVYHIFDFAAFSARTLGQAWRSFTAEEKGSFTEAFASLLFSTYLNHIDGYNGEKVRIVSERRSSSGRRVEIGTELTMSDGRILPVSYRMMPGEEAAGDAWVVYDVFVEGISLVNNYRTQFQEILISSSPATLIERVRARATEAGH